MTVAAETFSLAKKLEKIDIVSQLRAVVKDLNSGPKSMIGYIAKRRYLQFGGYLFVHNNIKQIRESMNQPIPNFVESDLVTIKKAHALLANLNRTLVNDLKTARPYLDLVLDPYATLQHEELINVDDLLDTNIFKQLKDAMNKSTPVNKLNALVSSLKIDTPAEAMSQACLSLIEDISNAGVNRAPDGFEMLIIKKSSNDPQFQFFLLVCAVACIRKMIGNIDQLLYQALLSDKPAILHEDNIINIGDHNFNVVSEGIEITVQPTGPEFFSNLHDLILVDIKEVRNQEMHKWFVAESIQLSFNQKTGNNIVFKLRALDDDFNPYSKLLK